MTRSRARLDPATIGRCAFTGEREGVIDETEQERQIESLRVRQVIDTDGGRLGHNGSQQRRAGYRPGPFERSDREQLSAIERLCPASNLNGSARWRRRQIGSRAESVGSEDVDAHVAAPITMSDVVGADAVEDKPVVLDGRSEGSDCPDMTRAFTRMSRSVDTRGGVTPCSRP